MADLHREFGIFHDRIMPAANRTAALRNARDAVRQRIRNYFQDTLRAQIPKFRSQGSFTMGTMVNPINGQYDIDDGIYLQHLDRYEDESWPAAATVHDWIVRATERHANEKPAHKRACVRVCNTGLYHVDLPCYGELKGKFMLAVKGETMWPNSDPLALTAWFKSHVHMHGEQLRRIVRFLKAWADFQSMRLGKMPGGCLLTVLATNQFHGHARDDVAFSYTLRAISDTVSGMVFVLNPVDFFEDLTARLTARQKARFQDAVQAAAAYATEAVTMGNSHTASKLWRKQFGDRFPLLEI